MASIPYHVDVNKIITLEKLTLNISVNVFEYENSTDIENRFTATITFIGFQTIKTNTAKKRCEEHEI